jgi:membrane protease YdiL (CAAX protease family)
VAGEILSMAEKAESKKPGNLLLTGELAAVFMLPPLLMYWRVLPNWPIPLLAVVAGAAYVRLRRDATFEQSRLYRFQRAGTEIAPALLRDVALMALLGTLVWRLTPELLFSLVRSAPVYWAAVMVLYPVVSVYPQEVLYRAYFFHRYEPLFGTGWRMITASAVAFGFVHIIFGSWISVALSAIGGILFGLTYRGSRSVLLTCVEHALFGNFIFTIGWGRFFFHGARL